MPSHEEFKKVTTDGSKAAANHLLYSWLSDDSLREQLYADLISRKEVLKFESRALLEDRAQNCGKDGSNAHCCDEDRPKTFRQDAFLVVHPEHVELAYKNSDTDPLQWSHTPYNALGGTFMLALDEPATPPPHDPFRSHDRQRDYCYSLLKTVAPAFDALATVGFKAGALLPLKQREFDLAALAESVAVNYAARLFGFSLADLPLLTEATRKTGDGLMYVNVGQHFSTEPATIAQAKLAFASLTQRAAELIDLYDRPAGKDQQNARDDLDEELCNLQNYLFEGPAGNPPTKIPSLENFKPVMLRMAGDGSVFSTTEKAIMVIGMVGGTITNLRAAVCIAVKQFFQLTADDFDEVCKKAILARLARGDASWTGRAAEDFRSLVEEALRVNPPAPFVPRRAAQEIPLAVGQVIPKDSLIVIAVGGGSWDVSKDNAALAANPVLTRFSTVHPTRNASPAACPFSKAFGGPPEPVDGNGRAEYLHSCIGKDMAMHSIAYTVRQLMVLPGLSQSLDEKNGEPSGLTKRGGFICERYPLEYQREKLLRQQPLQTVLSVKNPVPENALALKRVLQYGAPFIEKVLRDSQMVHFASFVFLENDSKLVLFTAYDGDIDSYIGHFAREFGPLFDRFFDHIENRPPAPIKEHAFEFVQFLKLYQHAPAVGYFFSAYPEAQADQIKWRFNKERKYNLFELEGGND